jgi:hypothetical protein
MALLPWLSYAAASIEKYSTIRKSCVFCFEAFLCRIACSDRTVVTARHVLPHLKTALEREIQLRGVGASDVYVEEGGESEGMCDLVSLGVAANVDGVECSSCKMLCHFSHFSLVDSSSSLVIFCYKCAASSPADAPLTLTERVRPRDPSPQLLSVDTHSDTSQRHPIARHATGTNCILPCHMASEVRRSQAFIRPLSFNVC